MKKYRVYLDEQIKVWQLIENIVEAKNEKEAIEKALRGDVVEVSSKDVYWDTEDHIQFEEPDRANIDEYVEEIGDS